MHSDFCPKQVELLPRNAINVHDQAFVAKNLCIYVYSSETGLSTLKSIGYATLLCCGTIGGLSIFIEF